MQAMRNLMPAGGRVRRPCHRRAGFTLIELLVVIGIIILLIGIAAPAIGPAMTSNYRTQAIHALNSSLVTAQTYALSSTTDVAVRIERAAKLDGYGRLTNRANPQYLDHQQIRFVALNRSNDLSKPAFSYIKDSKITVLPNSIWFAPTNFYTPNDGNNTNDFGPNDFFQPTTSNNTLHDPDSNGAAAYCPFDTFYIVFSPNGMLAQWPVSKELWYIDETQKFQDERSPGIWHPQDSAPGVLLYERKKLESAPNNLGGLLQFLSSNGQALYINRYLGTTVESQ